MRNYFESASLKSITLSDDRGTITHSFYAGETWMELTEEFLRILLAKGFIFNVEAIMDGVEESHQNWLDRDLEVSRKVDTEE